MKKTYSILAAIALLATSCVSEPVPVDTSCEQNGKATFTYIPDFGKEGPATRALAENPDVKNIYFAVFDAAGYKLSEYAEAVPNTYATTNEPDLYSYSVELTVTDQPRIIHIIANAPEHLSYGSEAEVIGSLCTYSDAAEDGDYDRQDAYWDRIYLADGVWAKPEEEMKTSRPEEYEAQKAKYDNVVSILNGAKLVRNFTKLNVVNNADDFVLTGFYITNVPDRGSVAPYNRNTGMFQTDYRSYTTIDAMRAADRGNYQGFTPANVRILSIDGMSDAELAARRIDIAADEQTEGASAYCYEREIAREKPIYIIIAGRYSGHSESYYKIDLRDNDGQYFPILRNFNYRVNIKSVSRNGASTVQGALSAAPSGDIDTSLELEDLTNISDGRSQIFVSETSEVLVGNDPVHIRYMYIPNLATGDVVNTTLEQWAEAGHDAVAEHLSYVTISSAEGEAGAVFSGDPVVKTSDETDKFRDITLQPVVPGAVIKTEVVTIEGHYWTGSEWSVMTRTVTFHLREKLDMQVVCVPTKVPASLKEKIRVDVLLETGLPSSIFSLDMLFEAQGLSVTSDNSVGQDVPVSSGASTIPANTKPAYVFTRTITWSEYDSAPVVDGKKVFSAYFITNKVVPSDQIYVSNKYFNQKSVEYTTYTAKHFSNARFSGSLVLGSNCDFLFDMDAFDGSSYTVQIGMKGIEPDISETGLTYVGSSDGMEIYSMTVTGNTGNTVKLAPFKSGTDAVEVKLLADEYVPSSVNGSPLAGPVYIYVDVDHTDGTAIDNVALVGPDVTGQGQLVVGQSGKLTVYVSESASSIQIGSLTANRVTSGTGATITKDGRTYYAYTTNSNYTATAGSGAGGAGFNELIVKVGGSNAGTIEVPVWGINRSNTSIAGGAPDTDTWYVFQNVGRSRWAYNSGSTLALINGNPGYSSLMKFSSSSTTTKVFNAMANNYVEGTGGLSGSSFSFGNTGTEYTRSANNNQMRLAYDGVLRTYYWRGTDETKMTMNNGTNNNYSNWNVYPVTIIAPAH